jgi:hypothetical protein
MLRLGPVALVAALTCLAYSHQSSAAIRVAPSVADSIRPESVIEPMHYSSQYGYHCGMRNYPHEHREACQRTREGGYPGRRRGFGAGGRPVEN